MFGTPYMTLSHKGPLRGVGDQRVGQGGGGSALAPQITSNQHIAQEFEHKHIWNTFDLEASRLQYIF